MPIGDMTVQRGNIQSTFLLSVSLTPTSVATITSAEQTFTVPGLLAGDQISGVSFQGAITNLVDIVNFRVVSNNTLGISFANNTAGSLTPAAGVYILEVNRPDFLPLPSIIQ